jgi:hypothetical protein
MNNWFINNRELIKNLAINTGTSQNPTYTLICTTSEVGVETDLEEKDFYVFCDAIQRSVMTGVAMSLAGTIKIDVNNTAIQHVLGEVHTLVGSGEIAQFNNQLVQFDLLTGVEGGVLEYTKYQVNVMLKLESLGGAAEDEGSFGFTMVINGTGSEVSA